MDHPRGAFAPVPTPFRRTGDLDIEALKRHLRWLDQQGLDGVLLLGSNGEFPSLTVDERRSVAEAGASANTSLQLILNVGSCSILEAESLIEAAVECRYDAVLCPPPFYFKAAPLTGIAAFFRRVLDYSRLPVLLYHIPRVTGIGFTDELLDLIGDHPNLAGLKDSTGDKDELIRLSSRFASLSYLVGNDRLVADCLDVGGKGSISAVASIEPRLVKRAGEDRRFQKDLTKVRALIEEFGLIPAAKAILAERGFGDYFTRVPLQRLDRSKREDLLQRYAESKSLVECSGPATPRQDRQLD